MAGGRGERFWPRSRFNQPKQTLALNQFTQPLLIESVERLFPLIPEDNLYISTGRHLEDPFREILRNYNIHWIIEPAQRDTAAAIGFALTYLKYKLQKESIEESNFIAVILGADYRIPNAALFRKHLNKAIKLAEQNHIVTLGIKPTRPATGYGYIKKENLFIKDEIPAFKVEEFKEKPDRQTAEDYIATKKYLWNSGMFIASADLLLGEIAKFIPEHHEGFQQILKSDFNPKITKEVFEKLPKISIDYAVMEKTEHLLVLESSFEWDDLGDFLSLDRLMQHDANGNAIEGLWAGLDTEDCLIIGKNNDHNRLITTLGIENLIIVDTDDALLICHKDVTHKIKELVNHINAHKKLKNFL
jgi:mannose-1-phosphate guanylyltransferase